MSSVYICPRCNRPGFMPEGLRPEQLVHCPQCGADFAVGEGLPLEVGGPEVPEQEFVPVARSLDLTASPSELGITLEGQTGSISEVPLGLPAWEGAKVSSGPGWPAGEEEILESLEPTPQGALRGAEFLSEQSPESSRVENLTGELSARSTEGEGTDRELAVAPAEWSPEGPSLPEVSGDSAVAEMSSGVSATKEGVATSVSSAWELLCPHCHQRFPLAKAQLASTGESLPEEVARVLEEQLEAQLARTEGAWAGGWHPAQISPGTVRIQVPEEEQRARPFARQPRKKVNVLKELISWVGGAVLGLLIAYYLLVLIRGDTGNFLKLPLPGLRSTYKYSPSWFPSFLKPSASGEKNSAEETRAEASER